MSLEVPWTRPHFTGAEPPNAWFTGRRERQAKGLARLAVLQNSLARVLNRDPDDRLVIRALAEVAMGITIAIEGREFTRISDSSVAITDAGGETQFLNLDTGERR